MANANATNANATNNANTDELTVYTTREAAKHAAQHELSEAQQLSSRLIAITERNPSRFAGVFVDNKAWDDLQSVDACYRPLLSAILDKAAKSILKNRVGSMAVFPREIDGSIFTADSILSEAVNGSSDWLSKDELTAAWEASETRKQFINHEAYKAGNTSYRKAVAAFTDMILKLAGKTSTYQPEELDKMLSKLHTDDLDSEFGSFAVRRIEALRNKPSKPAIDLDIL